MQWIRNKLLCVTFEIIYLIIQIANIFLGNIAVYEASEGINFNYWLLLNSPTFWVVIIIQFLHFMLTTSANKIDARADGEIAEAINKSEIKLLGIVNRSVKKGDFETANKALKVFDKVEEKRR